MIAIPDEGDLAWLFAAPVVVEDADARWGYSALAIHGVYGDDVIDVEVHPAAGTVRVAWSVGERVLVELPLRRVRAIAIEAIEGAKALVVSFEPSVGVAPLRLQLAPKVRVSWGVERW